GQYVGGYRRQGQPLVARPHATAMNRLASRRVRGIPALVAVLGIAGCVARPPQRNPPTGPSSPPQQPGSTIPSPLPEKVPEPVPVPVPVLPEPVLSAASSALVRQAQAQL